MVALREAYEDRDSGIPAVYDAENRLIAWEGGNHSFPFGYKGYFRDLDTGMYYLGPALRSSDLSSIPCRATDESEARGHRYYNPLTGRFLNRDPIREAGGLNLYAHTRNDHINLWDVRGLSDADQYEDAKSGDHLQRRSSSFLGFDFTLYGFSHGDWLFRRYHAQNRAYEDWLGERRIPIHIGSGTLQPNFRNPILRYSQQEPGGSFDGLRAHGGDPDGEITPINPYAEWDEIVISIASKHWKGYGPEIGGVLYRNPKDGKIYASGPIPGRDSKSITLQEIYDGFKKQWDNNQLEGQVRTGEYRDWDGKIVVVYSSPSYADYFEGIVAIWHTHPSGNRSSGGFNPGAPHLYIIPGPMRGDRKVAHEENKPVYTIRGPNHVERVNNRSYIELTDDPWRVVIVEP